MILEPYLFFDGTCAEAIAFYEDALGARREYVATYAEAPDDATRAAGDPQRVMHASLRIGDRRLMASDVPSAQAGGPLGGATLSLGFASIEEARSAHSALAAGGHVTVPFGPTFWSQAFSMLIDRFGTRWMINGPGIDAV